MQCLLIDVFLGMLANCFFFWIFVVQHRADPRSEAEMGLAAGYQFEVNRR
jgi:hypothetical protein